jgi:acyl carrier protein
MADNTQATVEERVKAIIVEQLGLEEGVVSGDASLIDDLGADSLDLVEVIMALEEQFDIEIPDEEAEGIETLGQAVAYVEKRLAENV